MQILHRIRRWCFVAILLLAAVSLLVAGRPAMTSALSLDPDPLLFAFGDLRGEVDVIAFSSGVPEGAALLEGAVSPTDATAVLRVALDAGSTAMGPLGVFVTDLPAATLVSPTGARMIPSPAIS